MKIHKVLCLVLIGCAAFAVSAKAGDRHKGNNKQAVSKSGGSSGAQIQSSSGPRFTQRSSYVPMRRNFQSSPRMTTRSTMPTQQWRGQHGFSSEGNTPRFTQRSGYKFTPRTFSGRSGDGVARFQNNQNFGTTQNNRVNRSLDHSNRRLNATAAGNGFSSLGNSNRNFNRTGTANRTAQFGTDGRNRTVGNISPGHNHVFAQQSVGWHRDWDRHHDHWWNGHRCRFVNNTWIIFDIGFIPWFGWPYYDYYAYDYYPPVYPYGYGYGYDSGASYGSNYYDQNGYDSSYDDQGGYDSSYYNGNAYGSSNDSAEAAVADAQQRLARAGYYHGQIDGVLGPETRHALVRYQSDRGLEPSGNLTPDTLRSLGMQQGARYGAANE